MQSFDSLIVWTLLGAFSLFMTILCVTFSRLVNLIMRPIRDRKDTKIVVVETPKSVGSNVRPIQENH